MKIALFDDYAPGLVRGDEIVDLSGALPSAIMALPGVYRMNALIEQFDQVRGAIQAAAGGPGKPLSAVKLRAPVPAPSKMLMAMGNYHEGLTGTARPLGLFLKAPSTILDPGGTVVLPPDDALIFHHEAELAVIIGKRCRDVPADKALDHVFGYTGLVDVSARGMGPGVGFVDKSFETFCPLGPWITLTDEIPDPQAVSIKLWQNDQPRQDYTTSDMEHKVAALIAYGSHVTTLMPGDVIGCGTNHQGLGPMQDGETTTLEIGGVGRMTVSVKDPSQRKWPMQIDPNIGKAIRAWRKGEPLDHDKAFMKRIA
jgi:2-keto-4-pentenoate hydratase/2-oxohepta-3-ene-1,7-dioic acid hydratase in catechol pathway